MQAIELRASQRLSDALSWLCFLHEASGALPGVADDHGEPVVGGDHDAVVHGGVASVAGHSEPVSLPPAVAIVGHVEGAVSALWAPAEDASLSNPVMSGSIRVQDVL